MGPVSWTVSPYQAFLSSPLLDTCAFFTSFALEGGQDNGYNRYK
jgi:hypothetical protein